LTRNFDRDRVERKFPSPTRGKCGEWIKGLKGIRKIETTKRKRQCTLCFAGTASRPQKNKRENRCPSKRRKERGDPEFESDREKRTHGAEIRPGVHETATLITYLQRKSLATSFSEEKKKLHASFNRSKEKWSRNPHLLTASGERLFHSFK